MVETLSIPSRGGRYLGARLYRHGTPRAGVVIHGGTAIPQQFYAALATYLARRNLAVLTYDFRGVGESSDRPVRDDDATMTDWVADAEAAQAWLGAAMPGRPLLAIGHSFGGQVAAALQPRADAMVFVGAQSGFYRTYPWLHRARLWAMWRLAVPTFGAVLGHLPGWAGLGQDLPRGVAEQWARWNRTPGYFLSDLPELRDKLAAYDRPILSLTFSDDGFVTQPNARWLHGQLASAELEHRHIRPAELGLLEVGHFGLFRRASADTLWPIVGDFLVRHAHGLRYPSPAHAGADEGRAPSLSDGIMADLAYGR